MSRSVFSKFSIVLAGGGVDVVLEHLCERIWNPWLLGAFSSLLGWSYYGERGISYLLGGRYGKVAFRFLFLGAILWGSTGNLTAVWQLSDLCNAMMAVPNLTALLLLSSEVLRLWKQEIKNTPED